MILQKIKSTEKIVRMIEAENMIAFETDRKYTKEEIAQEVEKLFSVKVENVRTLTRKNKKIAYVRLTKDFVAADVASKLGVL
ncbi:50S ribosomal protein L23 [uncultured archaeon]|nr:50S ribosomal protein L23 [uncultured archaeon]